MLPYTWSQNGPEEKGGGDQDPEYFLSNPPPSFPSSGQTWREGPKRCQLKAAQQAGLGASHPPAALGALRLRGLPWPVSLPGCPTVWGGRAGRHYHAGIGEEAQSSTRHGWVWPRPRNVTSVILSISSIKWGSHSLTMLIVKIHGRKCYEVSLGTRF